ncbi:hypothetical protein [Martelella alba]|uniref:SapC protein n=1 Tax=Martelella alba TaxID=2590451 RepID=A0ABY2SQ29_9HYPH|nr:hypothetical protein [Martelella alba]TKI07772.1 hypothetical protein FCN80_04835 [Martelella alba]
MPPSPPTLNAGENPVSLPGEPLLRRFAQFSERLPSVPALLHIGDQTGWLITAADGKAPSSYPFDGYGVIAARFFHHRPPAENEMENAIMAVEERIMPLSRHIPHGAVLCTTDSALYRIGLLAGLPDRPEMMLTLEAAERTFDRLAAVIRGRPAAWEGLPGDKDFAATLLILRELMHHLQFSFLTVYPDVPENEALLR